MEPFNSGSISVRWENGSAAEMTAAKGSALSPQLGNMGTLTLRSQRIRALPWGRDIGDMRRHRISQHREEVEAKQVLVRE